MALILSAGLVSPALAAAAPGLDALMGGSGRAQVQAALATQAFDHGKTYSWPDYSSWGKELFINGFVKTPPAGSAPSQPISKYFTCTSCHNYEREDPVLRVQDPEARFAASQRTGANILLLQGATLWGGVNRTAFYTDDYARYHDLCLPKGEELASWLPCGPIFGFWMPGCRTMNPNTLVDATQICSNYCSVGRYLKAWELNALLAFFWDQEIMLDDLDLTPQGRAEAFAVLTAPAADPREIGRIREELAGAFSSKAGNTFRGRAKLVDDSPPGKPVVTCPDGAKFIGDARRGGELWKVSCGHCHERKEHPLTRGKAKNFSKDADDFHDMIARGTRHSFRRYMPNFPLERLSRQQSTDILAFLQQFSATGTRP